MYSRSESTKLLVLEDLLANQDLAECKVRQVRKALLALEDFLVLTVIRA